MVVRQAGTVAMHEGRICLVTVRSRLRWVIPKGGIEPGQSDHDAARAEAWEEAGILGQLSDTPLGTYTYTKYDQDYEVTVYLMQVHAIRNRWPEQSKRSREWVGIEEAVQRVAEPGLKAVLQSLISSRPIVEQRKVNAT